jgi:hypothetical protein
VNPEEWRELLFGILVALAALGAIWLIGKPPKK